MRIAIIGLGLIGGSLGLALRQANWQEAEVVGYIRRPEAASLAMSSGVVDRVETSLEATARDAHLVIIATPVLTVKDIFAQIAGQLAHGCIVTDTASTKSLIMDWAEELLPPTISFVGGHPMAGKETSGIKSASASLFRDCAYCLIPAPRATPTAVQTVTDMIGQLGAIPLHIEAQEHDHLVAGISHLPFLLSTGLVSVTTQNPAWNQMSRLAATGYRDLTRLASGNSQVNADICLSNREAIISWIDEYDKELQILRRLLDDGGDEIKRYLAQAGEKRQEWLERRC